MLFRGYLRHGLDKKKTLPIDVLLRQVHSCHFRHWKLIIGRVVWSVKFIIVELGCGTSTRSSCTVDKGHLHDVGNAFTIFLVHATVVVAMKVCNLKSRLQDVLHRLEVLRVVLFLAQPMELDDQLPKLLECFWRLGWEDGPFRRFNIHFHEKRVLGSIGLICLCEHLVEGPSLTLVALQWVLAV